MSAAELTLIGNPPRARVSTRFLRSELKIIFGRRRNIAGMGVLAAVPVILAISVRMSSPSQGGGPDFISAIAGNGLFVAFAALALELPLFLPLAVSAISGDSVAGEANIGTLRYLLAIPAGRTRLLAIKYTAIVIFAAAATFLVALVGAIMGLATLRRRRSDPAVRRPDVNGRQRVAADLELAVSGGSVSALGAIGLFISTLTEQPIGATIAVVLVDVLMFILDSISQLDWLHPWLLTHWWTAFGDLLRIPSRQNRSSGD